MRKAIHPRVWALVLAVVVSSAVRGWGGDATVNVRGSGFSPASVTINVHETVWFYVVDDNGPYCVQSTIGAWTPWYLFDEGDGFGLTINEAGDYYYRDIFTYHTGVIHVGEAPPDITIESIGIVGGQFECHVTGAPLGTQVVLESSTSLGTTNWVPLQTNTVNSATVSFSQPVIAGAHFFRVVQSP
jgi:hypothetical protein